MSDWTTAGLWLAVVGSGIYHGVNPGMGWPLAVSAGLMGRGQRDLLPALGSLALGHCLAMAGILLPFALIAVLVEWQRVMRLGAGILVVAMGAYLFINRRHPRYLARIRPAQLVLWSFAVALAHGAGLMLVPIYLGLCQSEVLDTGHRAAITLAGGTLSTAVVVSLVHTAAMITSGGIIALAVYYWLGPQFISKSWINLDIVWAMSLLLVGLLGMAGAGGLL